MQPEQIRTDVHNFIRKNFVYSASKTLRNDESLLGSGVIDSTGVLELIAFLEERFKVTFADDELIADNFDSVNKIVDFISRKAPVG